MDKKINFVLTTDKNYETYSSKDSFTVNSFSKYHFPFKSLNLSVIETPRQHKYPTSFLFRKIDVNYENNAVSMKKIVIVSISLLLYM